MFFNFYILLSKINRGQNFDQCGVWFITLFLLILYIAFLVDNLFKGVFYFAAKYQI